MNISEFHFIRPYWLFALLPAIGLCIALMRRNQPSGVWSEVCDAALLPFILQQKAQQQNRSPLIMMTIAAILTIVALAGPTWERLPSPVFRNQSALVIALDLSLSMNAGDIKSTRLTRARYKIADILKQRKDGQTALLVYAGEAFTVTPLTNDIDTIESQLSALTTDIMPSPGSNTAAALQKAVDLLKQAGLPKGQILLVTDGVDKDKTLAAIQNAENYSVSVLGVGTVEGAPIKAVAGDFVKDAQGNIVIPKLDASVLEKVAQAGHGLFTPLTDDNSDIDRLSAFFNQAVVTQEAENKDLLLQQWVEKGPWLLLAVLPLAALSFRKGLLTLAFLLLMPLPKTSYALEWQDLWQTKDQQAQQAFKKQDYAKAAEQFKNPEWQAAAQYKAGDYAKSLENLKSVKTAQGYYNQGNALAQSGKLPEAVKAYEQALKLKPDDADTLFNKELVEKEIKKQQEQKDQQKQDNKQDKQENKDEKQDNKDQQKSGQDKDKDKDKDKQGKPEDQKDNQSKPEQQKDQKEEQAKDNQEAKPSEQKPEQKDQAQKEKEQAADAKPKPAEPKPDEKDVAPKAAAPADAKQDESQQANEQWLKRIPDDPAGLLKRKFKYQYGQQEHSAPANTDAW